MKIYEKITWGLILTLGMVSSAMAIPGGGDDIPIPLPSPEAFGLIPLLSLAAFGVIVAVIKKYKRHKIHKK